MKNSHQLTTFDRLLSPGDLDFTKNMYVLLTKAIPLMNCSVHPQALRSLECRQYEGRLGYLTQALRGRRAWENRKPHQHHQSTELTKYLYAPDFRTNRCSFSVGLLSERKGKSIWCVLARVRQQFIGELKLKSSSSNTSYSIVHIGTNRYAI